MKRALLACTDAAETATITAALNDGYTVDVVTGKRACLDLFRTRHYDVTLLDLDLIEEPDDSANSHDCARNLRPFREAFPTAEIVVLAREKTVRDAVRVVKAGASDYLTFPVDPVELQHVLQSLSAAKQTEAERDYLRDEFWQNDAAELTRTTSPVMREAIRQIQLVAPTKTTVLLSGETGTGKGVLAKVIHQHSSRSAGPFVSVHCGAIPDTLAESELFGHERGAFTGATQRRLGRFEVANGGTILLDEIATLSAAAQVKLLQVLQDRTLQRVGSEAPIEIDVRVIAATNVDLKALCEHGEFRLDLYYRLNVFPIAVPPLRSRPEDIPLLAENLIRRLNRLNDRSVRGIEPQALKALQTYSWPGNVRELENLLERAFILENSDLITATSFPGEVVAAAALPAARTPLDTSLTLEQVQQAGLDEIRHQYLKAQLTANAGRIDRTAAAAGITTRHLHQLMRRYGLCKQDFKPPRKKPEKMPDG